MPLPIADYALIGDRSTAALVGIDGSIDWLCLPHFDSPACFAALLGEREHGRWLIGPAAPAETTRRYLPGSLVLETTHRTATGTVRITDSMPADGDRADVVRIIDGIDGEVELDHELTVRFDYGAVIPWVRRVHAHGEKVLQAIAGPDRLVLRGGPLPEPGDRTHRSTLTVHAGDRIVYDLCWQPSYTHIGPPLDAHIALEQSMTASREWLKDLQYDGPYLEAVRTSVLLLHALTDIHTGGIIAAPTTSLPEDLGGERNWDYRFTWLRDASLTVEAMLAVGLHDRSGFWRDWLLRAIAGDPKAMLVMYRRDGGREMIERTLDHLPGYAGSTPVRVGNGAWAQRQHDVLGQVMLTLEKLRSLGIHNSLDSWRMQRGLLDDLAEHWQLPDQGLWEIRGEPRMFTHSRAMMWAAFDRGVRAVEGGLEGDATRWRELRDALRDEVLAQGFSTDSGAFRQHYDTEEVDASLLQLPTIGIIDAHDPRFTGTVAKIERDLVRDGMPLRYRTGADLQAQGHAVDDRGVDGLAGDEHPFVLCGFWMVIAYAQSGRIDDAHRLMTRLLTLRNDVGLLAEEVDPATGTLIGNFPQAFSHLGLVLAADAISRAERA